MKDIHGIVNIDKPAGWSSHKTVHEVKKLSGAKKAGHAGTLDPYATGVLLVLINEACKFSNVISAKKKTYIASAALGRESDTWDVTGNISETSEINAAKERIKDVLKTFKGEYIHRVPKFSAKKFKGRTFYDITRSGGEPPERFQRTFIYNIELAECNASDFSFTVTCSSGTYIRTLVVDIAEKLGTKAYLKALKRTQVDGFGIDGAASPENWKKSFTDLNTAVKVYPHVIINNKAFKRVLHGNTFSKSDIVSENGVTEKTGVLMVYSENMEVGAIASIDNGRYLIKRGINIADR